MQWHLINKLNWKYLVDKDKKKILENLYEKKISNIYSNLLVPVHISPHLSHKVCKVGFETVHFNITYILEMLINSMSNKLLMD